MRLRPHIAALAAALLLSSCGDDNPASPGGPPPEAVYNASFEFFTSPINTLWEHPSGDVYGAGPSIMKYDGRDWTPIALPNTDLYFQHAWATSNGDLYAVALFGLYRFDGSEWSSMSAALRDYWGAQNGEIFGYAWDDRLYHYDGSDWSQGDTVEVDSGLNTNWTDITGDGPDNVYTVGYDGVLAHFDGNVWTAQVLEPRRSFYYAWKEPGGPLYLSGYDSLYAYDGSELRSVPIPLRNVQAICFKSSTEIYVAGEKDYPYSSVFRFDGAAWHEDAQTESPVRSVWGDRASERLLVSTRTEVVQAKGTTSTPILGFNPPDFPTYRSPNFTAAWGSTEAGVYVAGNYAFRYWNGEWTDLKKQDLTLTEVSSIWGRSSEEIYAVGQSMLLHFDGQEWVSRSGAGNLVLSDVSGDEQSVVAVGYEGAIVRFDGESWEREESGTTYHLFAVSIWPGGGFAGGENGSLIRYDGSEWRPIPSPVSWAINDLLAFDPDQVIAVGSNGTEICIFDGREWSPIFVGYMGGSNESVWGTSVSNLFIAKSNGSVVHWDGGTASYLPRVTSDDLRAIWGDAQGQVFAAGYGGVIRYFR